MRTYKRISIVLILILLMQIILPVLGSINIVPKSTATEITETLTWDISSTEDDNVTAVLTTDGTLKISGAGAMKSWNSSISVPWCSYGSNIIAVVIGDGVTSIGSFAFDYCTSLTSIELPEGVTNIGSYAFYGCTSLTSINVNENNQNYCSENGVLFNKDKTTIICYPAGKTETTYTIPDSVTSIASDAFKYCTSLTSIELPEGVMSIGSFAFGYCKSLTGINIPEGVTTIGSFVFWGCDSLTSIELPEGLTSIGSNAFGYCKSLTGINIPEGVTTIEDWAFYGCSSLKITDIPDSVTSIGSNAFYKCQYIYTVAVGETAEEEITINTPNIIKRTLNEKDIMYANGTEPTLNKCTMSEDNQTLTFDAEDVTANNVKVTIKSGALNGLVVVVVVPSGTIFYDKTSWTNKDVTATIYVAEGETITNNEGKNTYTFEKNGTYTFKYQTTEGEEKESTATVSWIDKEAPTITSIEGNPTEWTTEDVTLTINAEDTGVGLAEQAYSFDGGATWQEDNTKTYTENTSGIVIKVRDALGNETTETINITKIVLRGDANGDGKVDFKDILAINKHRLGKSQLTGMHLEAADVNGDSKVDFMDILQINKYRLGKISEL